MPDELEGRLAGDFLFSDALTETDIRAFVALIRFDAAYHGLFKTNRREIRDYPRLSAYLAGMVNVPGDRETMDMDHILQGYYPIKALNPRGVVPKPPMHVRAMLDVALKN